MDEKPRLRPWEITAQVLGSIFVVFGITNVLGNVPFRVLGLGYLSAPAFFLSVILIPAVFAFPIIIKKPKLLFVPAGVIPLVLALLFIWVAPLAVPIMSVAFGIVGVYGLVVGFAVHYARERAWEFAAIFIFLTIGGAVLLSPVFLMGYNIMGRPVTSVLVNSRVRAHVAENYDDFDFTVGRTWYDFKDDRYFTRIYDNERPGRYFRIVIHRGRLGYDPRDSRFWPRSEKNHDRSWFFSLRYESTLTLYTPLIFSRLP